jgi:phosphatidate cytidylyltransferase
MRERALSAAVLVPPLVIALVIGGWAILLVVAVAAVLGAWEVFRLLRFAGYPSLPWLGIVLTGVLVLDAGLQAIPERSGLLLLAIGVILVAVGAFARTDPRDGLVAWMTTIFGALYVSMLAFIVRLGAGAPPVPTTAPLGGFLDAERGWILLLVLGVWAYDTGAYLIGRRFGRAKFLTHISPSKSYAGLVGGLVVSTIVVTLMAVLLGEPPIIGIVLGPLLGLAAQAGDLAESMLKRAAGAKESSRLIPGHGGLLDRVDSFLFAAPVAYFYVVAVLR